jgi:hypothetical protein
MVLGLFCAPVVVVDLRESAGATVCKLRDGGRCEDQDYEAVVFQGADEAVVADAVFPEFAESALDWHLVSIDEANSIEEDSGYGVGVTEMINSTRNNPNAIILGTFHTYKTN